LGLRSVIVVYVTSTTHQTRAHHTTRNLLSSLSLSLSLSLSNAAQVFIVEYLGPLLIYPIFYFRPSFIYGAGASSSPYHWIQQYNHLFFLLSFSLSLSLSSSFHRLCHL
jgi:hypothetical protein